MSAAPVGWSGSTDPSNCYDVRHAFQTAFGERLHAPSLEHPKWAYRIVHGLLILEGWPVNKKGIERLWRQEGGEPLHVR